MIYVTHDQIEAMTLADQIVVLESGLVQQAGTPLELYHHPSNLFVAGFIGSPNMNFMATTVSAVDDKGATVALPGGGQVTVPVQPGRLKAGDSVTLGVRPEHLRPADAGELSGEVLVVERLGGETFLYTRLPDESMITIQADGEIPTRVHERIAVKVNPGTCHLFDASGAAVERAQRHPLADMKRPTALKAS
jgi:multiple sugar transport system ATP-binding protein